MMAGEAFTPKNELEKKLLAAWEGSMSGDEFMQELLLSEVFMPIEDDEVMQGVQRSPRAQPLVLEAEDGSRVLAVFTSPDRAKPFLKDFPLYGGGLLTEFKWVLEKMGAGHGIALNPGCEVGFDMEPEMLGQLG
ncbi:MAG: SseB protein [Betaproteobacteria bacterium CG2_30_59_46]|nr:MAG: SseB protein [Betaproteobacteria bacterium CG2_30_59_46]PIQ13805.1 MAG: SseB protein [Hydrogenophilales bacterium CG18_big_fil_WC_8_21_14_2_50_58_12]PIY01789.1 MAG: SseB protein [Hydrogenophilales bacterium CG_4_10_14_3_um_filter_58_23]PJB08845.1 MAG: SseB protein [Hydrogenophilales bacterium CG_4_9_14_3_um_filter_59_35]